jgi:endo-1,4-beta-xylanase
VEQQRHAFRFGTCAPAARLVDTTDPDNVRFQQELARLFNTVTFENDLKWAAIDWGQDPQTAPRAAEWLRAHGIDLRGHCLLWGSYGNSPGLVRDLEPDALRAACEAHVTGYATRWRGKVYLWDVVNEAGSNVELWDKMGWDAFADAFRWAQAADPGAKLCYNDYAIAAWDDGYRGQVHKRVQFLLDHGAPVTTLGDQCHMGTPLVPMDKVLAAWDEWAAFGKDLEVTEYDLGCRNDQVHADYTRDFMTAAFSHPKMTAFIMWGFWEGSHWRAAEGGAMFRQDWSRRPAVDVYEDLVLHQWWTRWHGPTDARGVVALRAFYGTQKVTAEAGGRQVTATVEMTPGASTTAVVLRLPE